MRWSSYYLYTTREVPRDAEVVSHQLMIRAGMIRKLAAGIYTYLPLGWRSLRKLSAIVRRELEAAGSTELSMPAIQPAELWQESGRWQHYGKELLRMQDRHDRDFCFGPTHEEVITDIVRHDVTSYRQLPRNLFQIQTKFRDEIRPRFGLLRGREFIMKDAYSFHADAESLDQTYDEMGRAYERVFEACRLEYSRVEADTGTIGGSSSHEFMVLAETGENAIASCPHCGYAANLEKAETRTLAAPAGEPVERGEVATPGATTVEEVTDLLGTVPQKLVKTMLYETGDATIAVVVRGDRAVNEVKLKNYLDVQQLELASEDAVRAATGAPVGFAGPVGLPEEVRLIGDSSVRDLTDFVVGGNKADTHLVGVNWGSDVDLAEWTDVLLIVDGDDCPRCDGTLRVKRGIEVGHIFKLGTKYSKAMACTYTDDKGKGHAMEMGCYGLGIGRTVAAAIEQNHDEKGIVWPLPLAPFEVIVSVLDLKDEDVVRTAERIYTSLRERKVDALLDDRDERPGVKFKDADLIGVPLRVVVGARSLAEDKVEISQRRGGEKLFVATADAVDKLLELLLDLAG